MSPLHIADWHRTRIPGGVLLSHRRGHQRGMIRVRRDRALRSMSGIVSEAIAEPPRRFVHTALSSVRRLLTDEGEHASVALLRSTSVTGEQLEHHLAIVAIDDGLIRFDGMCELAGCRDEFAQELEHLVRHCVTGNAAERRRMFEYRPPHRWRGVRRVLSSVWYPPTCPRDNASFEVFDAVPLADRGAQLAHELLAGDHAETIFERQQQLNVGAELSGTRTFTTSSTIVRLVDHRFHYEVRFHRTAKPELTGAHTAAFDALIHSIEPVPPAPRAAGEDPRHDALGWVL